MQTRARPLGLTSRWTFVRPRYRRWVGRGDGPISNHRGYIEDYGELAEKCMVSEAMPIAAADLMGLMLLEPPAKWGAVVIGSSRFGSQWASVVLMGLHGNKRVLQGSVPGRIIGESKDADGNPTYALHYKRGNNIFAAKRRSNICGSGSVSGHGKYVCSLPWTKRLKQIATRINLMAVSSRQVFVSWP